MSLNDVRRVKNELCK